MADRRSFSAAACKIKVSEVEIGWATGFRASENFNLFPIDIMGDLRTQRYEPTALKYSGSFEYIHILAEPLSKLMGGRLWLQGSTVEIIQYLSKTMTLEDIVTPNAAPLTVGGWVPESRVWSIAYGGVLSSNVSWVATDIRENVVIRPPLS